MKVIILAGGMQSTINSECEGIPKPMIDIGGKPLLWHTMRYFSSYGLNEFIICGVYRAWSALNNHIYTLLHQSIFRIYQFSFSWNIHYL